MGEAVDTAPGAILPLALRSCVDGQLYLLRRRPVVHERHRPLLRPCSTDTMLEGWLTSTCISWFIMEPGFILIIIFLPCLCNNHYVDTCNTRLNDIGCDISMFIG